MFAEPSTTREISLQLSCLVQGYNISLLCPLEGHQFCETNCDHLPYFMICSHKTIIKLKNCCNVRSVFFAKKRKIENRKMMEKEIDDFYLWQSLSSFLSDYIVVNLFQNAIRLFLASNKMESNNFVIYYWLIDDMSHKYKIY